MSKDFWTEELECEQDQLLDEQWLTQEALLEGELSHVHIWNRYKCLANRHWTYRTHLQNRRMTLFHNAVDNLGLPGNRGPFMRMVKGVKKQQAGVGCTLDPAELDQHVEYFKSTFGGEPTR